MGLINVLCMCSQESDAVALELEELRREQAGYEQQIQAVDEAMTAIQEQIDSMACTVSQNKVLVDEDLRQTCLTDECFEERLCFRPFK